MTIDWLKMLPALPLLWIPMPLPRRLSERLSATPPAQPRPPTIKGMMAVWSNWVSLILAGTGAYVLAGWTAKTYLDNPEVRGITRVVYGVHIVALVISVLVHGIRKRIEVNLFAPNFALCGIAIGLSFPAYHGFPTIGLFAAVVGWAFAIATKSPGIHLPATAVAFASSGYMLGEIRFETLVVGTGILLLPNALALLFGRPLFFVSSEFRR